MLPTGISPKVAGAILVALALLGTGFYIRHLKSSLADMTTERDAAVQQVELQNRAINQMKIESDEREQKARDLVKEAEAKAAPHIQKAQIIYRTKPSVPGDDCKSAMALINGESK